MQRKTQEEAQATTVVAEAKEAAKLKKAEQATVAQRVELLPTTDMGYREAWLQRVFNIFDLDGNGFVEATEVLKPQVLKSIDLDQDGVISESEFVEHFDAALPCTREQFDTTIVEFVLVASEYRSQRVKKIAEQHVAVNNEN